MLRNGSGFTPIDAICVPTPARPGLFARRAVLGFALLGLLHAIEFYPAPSLAAMSPRPRLFHLPSHLQSFL